MDEFLRIFEYFFVWAVLLAFDDDVLTLEYVYVREKNPWRMADLQLIRARRSAPLAVSSSAAAAADSIMYHTEQ